MKNYLVLFYFFVLFNFLFSEEKYENIIINKEDIVSVYDGDTFKINIKCIYTLFGKNIGVRIYGIDTPEIKNKNQELKKKAKESKLFLQQLLKNGKKIELKNTRRDKYFRILAEVYVDDIAVAEIMIKKGYGKEYYGGKK